MMRMIRAELAAQYQIPLHQELCDNPDDDCLGTCPMCEQELRYLEDAIEEKERNGYIVQHRLLEEDALKFQRDALLLEEALDSLSLDTYEDDDLTGYVVYEDPDAEE